MAESPAPPQDGRRWWVLAGACGGLMVLMLDSTVVNLALPALRQDLDASSTQLQWIPNAYLLVIAALVVTAGRIGDIVGRRRAFLGGLLLFGGGSALGGFAQSADAVIAARAVMGAGAAFILPLSLTLVTDSFPGGDRGRAMGIWAAVSSLALAIGPIAGGSLAEIDWRLIFWINLPPVVFGFLVTRWAAPETRDETSERSIDWPGFALLTVGLAAVTIGFAQAEAWGWTSTATLGTVAAGLLTLVAFWHVEHRVRNPIVEFDLFRNKPYFGASAAAFALVGAYWVVMFFEPQYLQDVLGYSPALAGVLILPITLPMVFVSPIADTFVRVLGIRVLMGTGMILGVIGLFVMGRIDGDTSYGVLFAGYLIFGVALGFVYAPMQTAAMAAMPAAKAGIASGVLAMNRILSGALALAITASVFHTALRSRIQEDVTAADLSKSDAHEVEGLANGTASAQAELASQPPRVAEQISSVVDDAFAHALSTTLWIPIALAFVGTILTWVYVRSPDDDPPPPKLPEHDHHKGRFHL